MIVDLHRHMWSGGQRYRHAYAGLPKLQRPETDFKFETAADEAKAEMDGAGIDASVLVVADFESRLGKPHFPIEHENELLVRAARRHPGRLIPFFGIDPRRPGAAGLFERAIREDGVRGLKLHPIVGFFPHDPACRPMYELCVAHGIPVLFHAAPAFHPRMYSRYAHPLEFDQVAGDFPDLVMIMGHAGSEWWHDLLVVAQGHPNMVLELAEWAPKLRDHPEETIGALARMRDEVGIERIAWATDFPGQRMTIALRDCVELFRALPATARAFGRTFSEAEVDALMGGNAARILGLA